jgi:hypothetical protein
VWLEQLSVSLARGTQAQVQSLANGFVLKASQAQLELSVEQGASHLTLRAGPSTLEIGREGAAGAHYFVSGGRLLERDGAPGIRAAFFVRDGAIEELIHVADRRAVVGYRFEQPRGVALRVSNGEPPVLEVADALGKPLAHASFPAAFDAAGRTWQVGLRAEGSSVHLLLPADATYPIVIDPLWSKADHMISARYQHTATPLSDGTVLLVGGSNEAAGPGLLDIAGSVLGGAEIYDPRTGSFQAVGGLSEARWGHSATLLRDGRVLVLGGFGLYDQGLEDAPGSAVNGSEIYDPETRTFTPFAALNHARGLHSATLLPDDRVLVVAGITQLHKGGNIVHEFEACWPNENHCDDLGTTDLVTRGHVAALRSDGHVELLSPQASDPRLDGPVVDNPPTFAEFDPSDDRIRRGLPFPSEVAPPYGTSPLLRLVPGTEQLEIFTAGAHVVLDDAHRLIEQTAQPLAGTGIRAPTTLTAWQGRGLAVGGAWQLGGSPVTLVEGEPSVEVGSAAVWSAGPFLSTGRGWASATPLPDGSVLVAGGAGASDTAETLPPAWHATERVTGLDQLAGPGHAATLLDNGRVLFTGGLDQPAVSRVVTFVVPPEPLAPLQADPAPLGQLSARRALHQAIALPTGEVLIAGGKTEPERANEELIDFKTGKITDLGLRLHDRGAGLYVGGSRIVFAGMRGAAVLEGPPWYERKIPLTEAPDCDAPGLVKLRNGHVLIIGRRSVVEVDAASAQALRTSPRELPRCDAAAAVLPDGRVFIAGGNDAADASAGQLASRSGKASEIYDPADGKLQSQPGLPFAVATPAAFSDGFAHVTLVGAGPEISSSLYCDAVADSLSCLPSLDVLLGRPTAAASHIRLPFGGVLSASGGSPAERDYRGSLWLRTQPARLGLQTDSPALVVSQGAVVELKVRLSKTWPEQSGGTSNGSSANDPVPVWLPAVGSSPAAIGTLMSWSANGATWRVPHTPYPGLGTLFFSIAGVLQPLQLVRITELGQGDPCQEGGECASGYCTEGVCCDVVCGGECQACTAELKGHGEDGACEAVSEGTQEAACLPENLANCGHNGLCDAAGHCASYPEGTVCGDDGATCNAVGNCRRELSARCVGDHTSRVGDAAPKDCGVYKCDESIGSCRHECESTAHCVGDNVCDATKVCQAPFVGPRSSVGCGPGCRLTADRRQAGRALWGSLALASSLLVRRLRRRRTTSRFAL